MQTHASNGFVVCGVLARQVSFQVENALSSGPLKKRIILLARLRSS